MIAAAAAVLMMTTGTLYAWAIFTQPLLVGFHWDVTATTWAYAIANFCLASIGAVVGGFWQDRVGPRRVALTGVILWGTGNVAAGLGTAAFGAGWLYLSYGVVGGIGAGMAYIAPIAMVTKWFPDRRGLAGGLVAGGFGLGAFIYNQVIPRLEDFRRAASHAGRYLAEQSTAMQAGRHFDDATPGATALMTPADVSAVMHVFIGSGFAYLLIGLLAASLFRNPPEPAARHGWIATQTPSQGLRPSQVIRTGQFYLLWLQLFINVIAGIAIISNAVFILKDLTNMPLANLAPLIGLVSLFNAVGRVFWGAVADRIGCRQTFAAMFAIQAAVLFWLTDVHDLHLALAGFSVILLCCGGGFGVMPAYSADYFGTRHIGLNYGCILSAWGVAGLVGPLYIARAKDLTGSFTGMLSLVAGGLLLAVMLPALIGKAKARAAREQVSSRMALHEVL